MRPMLAWWTIQNGLLGLLTLLALGNAAAVTARDAGVLDQVEAWYALGAAAGLWLFLDLLVGVIYLVGREAAQ